ncbi:MAG: ComF family protein [Vicinamibacterales bacterium]
MSTSSSTSSRSTLETSTDSIDSGATPPGPRFRTKPRGGPRFQTESTWRQTFRFVESFANLTLSRLFEPPCAACGATLAHPLEGAVCDLCWAGIHRITPPVCHQCGDPLTSSLVSLVSGATCPRCRESERPVDQSRAIGPYEGRLRDIIHALKYDGRRSIAPRLAAMMLTVGEGLLRDADCVVPVPLHPRRQRARGFNQAEDLARGLGVAIHHLLKRVVATAPQVDLPAHERARNVRDAFTLNGPRPWSPVAGSRWPALQRRLPSVCRLSADAANGRDGETSLKLPDITESQGGRCVERLVVVLVDDVTTTGATLEACARVLKAAGAREVRALTAARVVSGRR